MQLANWYRREECCRSCGHAPLEDILDLGVTPLADRLVDVEHLEHEDPRCPLTLAFCSACSLVQIRETVLPEILFAEDYPYFSSVSPALLAHFRSSVEEVLNRRQLGPNSLVLELASNDGYLLRNYVAQGIPVLGIDPAPEPARAAQDQGITTRIEFFGLALARKLREEGLRADILHANNVVAHVADSNDFIAGIAEVLKADGEAIIEFPYLGDLIENCEFDTIYHQHLCYFSLHAFQALCARHGLHVNRVQNTTIHGGSLRVFLNHHSAPDSSVQALLLLEQQKGMLDAAYYRGFARQVVSLSQSLRLILDELSNANYTIVGYGAAAKACTLLSHLGIDKELLPCIVDRNAFKHGKFMPGSRIPIRSTDWLRDNAPDYLLLLSWNFADEIMAQQCDFQRDGGQFILPIPEPRIVPHADTGRNSE